MSDDDSDDDVPLSAMPAVMKVASSGSGQTETVPISVESSSDEEDSPIFGFNKTTSNKSRGSRVSSIAAGKKSAPCQKTLSPKKQQGPACEVCGKSDDAKKFVHCTCCSEGIVHTYCCDPKIRGKPPDDFKCQHCVAMVKADPLVRSCALVSAFFARYGTFIGEVQDVRYATTSDGEPGPRGDRKEHLLYFPADGAELWHDLDAQECDEKILPIDEKLTDERRETDPLLKGRGARGQVWIPEVPGVVVAGYYPGRVVDVRVEAISPSHQRSDHGKVSYLVQYDAGDRHWHDLGHPRWRWKPELPPSARPGATQSLPNLSRQASSSSRKDGDAEDGGLARKIKSKEALVQLQEERRKKEERDKVGVKKESKEKGTRANRKRGISDAAGGDGSHKNGEAGDGSEVAAKRQKDTGERDDDDDDDEGCDVEYEDDDESESNDEEEDEMRGSVHMPGSARDGVRRLIAKALDDPTGTSSHAVFIPALPSGVPLLVGEAIEAALHEFATQDTYNKTARMLAANIKRNAVLRAEIYSGTVSTWQLVRMTPAELATAARKLERQASRQAAFDSVAIKPEHDGPEASGPVVDWRDGTIPVTPGGCEVPLVD